MKVRNAEINAHLLSSDSFEAMMASMVEIYNTCPDASRIRFIQAIEDQFKANSVARARTSSGSSSKGSGWRDAQKAQFAGRGAKWVKLTGDMIHLLNIQLNAFEADGDDVEDYSRWINKAGFAWVRYSGPRGTEAAQELAFEVRIGGSKIDHPKHLFKVTADVWNNHLADHHSVLGGTPFAMKLED